MSELLNIQREWIDLFQQMERSKEFDPSILAAPFLTVEPEDYNPLDRKTILFVGKATGGDWGAKSFWETRSVDERRAFTAKFLREEIDSGNYRSPFWGYARSLNVITSTLNDKISANFFSPLKDVVWSNIAKIGVRKGNPERRYLTVQSDLAKRTLAAEIKHYKPSLVVFVTTNYAESLLIDFFARSGIAWDGDSFKQLDSRSWARAKDKKMPPLLFLHHPQGKAAETIQLWLTYVTDMLKNPDSTPTIAA